ncbi:MAG: Matrixin [Gemmatimonadetes bacterium]|nr:Matrixin [Gemmatimonadota bacterium]
MRLATIAALTLAVAGCSGPEDCHDAAGVVAMTYPSSQFTTEEAAVFDKAAAKWNAFANRAVVRFEAAERTGVCTVTKSSDYGVGREHLARDGSLNGVIEIGAIYDCNNANIPGVLCFESILLHETGHAIGLGHVPDTESESVMFHRTTTTNFSPADHAECVAKHVCE